MHSTSYGVKELLLEICKSLLGDSVQLTDEVDLEKASIDKVSRATTVGCCAEMGTPRERMLTLSPSDSCLVWLIYHAHSPCCCRFPLRFSCRSTRSSSRSSSASTRRPPSWSQRPYKPCTFVARPRMHPCNLDSSLFSIVLLEVECLPERKGESYGSRRTSEWHLGLKWNEGSESRISLVQAAGCICRKTSDRETL